MPAAAPVCYCGFCTKSQHAVATLIAGPADSAGRRPYICDECVDLCADICATDRHKARQDKHLADVVRNGT